MFAVEADWYVMEFYLHAELVPIANKVDVDCESNYERLASLFFCLISALGGII
jgi:hypothetical protein